MKVKNNWSINHEECKNCGTIRYPHIAKGLCKRCYPLQIKLQRLEGWDISEPKSLKGFPHSVRPFIRTQEYLDGFKIDAKKQIKYRLNCLRMREEKLKSIIKGTDVEHMLNKIARMIGPGGDKLHHGVADLIDQNFNRKQKKLIYILLNKIEETVPWKGIRYGQHAAEAGVRAFINSFSKR